MNRLFAICSLVCLVSFPLLAADWPASELSVGPSYLHITEQDLIGWQVVGAVNPWRHISLVATVGAYQGNLKIPGPSSVDLPSGIGNVFTLLGGVRLRKVLAERLTLFAQSQAGALTIGQTKDIMINGRVARGLGETNALVITAGGGVQVGLTQDFAVEVRAEYLPMRVAGNWIDDNVQVTAAIVLRLGSH